MPCWRKYISRVRVVKVSALGMCVGQRRWGRIEIPEQQIPSALLWKCISLSCAVMSVCFAVWVQILCRVLLRYPQDKIESQHLLRFFSEGFVAEVSCFEVTAFNWWNSSSNSRSTWLFSHRLVKQKDLCNFSDSCIGKVFTAGGFTHPLIWRKYSVSHCLSSFPPQVDIVQTCIIEMKNRPGKPLFHLEHYIEGKYIKYNSNSGFVRDDNIRLTPQVRLCFMLSIAFAAGNFWALSRGLALLPRKETAGSAVQCQINFSICSLSAPYLGPGLSSAECFLIGFQLITVELNRVNTLWKP